MMKNRAVWLALIVLAIATILMVFVVLPQIGRGDRTANTQPPAGQEATPSAQAPTAPAAQNETAAAAQKMDRLKADAGKAVADFESLFANQSLPAPDAYAAARLAALTALKALADSSVPATVDAQMKASAEKAKADAAAALALIAKLPTTPAEAAAAIANIGRALRGEPLLPTEDPDLPRFDVLRVEKDGSTVIAGRGARDAKVELIDADKVIASTTSSASGDFAIVLDTPLAPGDHALSLRITTKDGKVLVSTEQATVSIPAAPGGEVLAMVSKPGAPSRLITLPGQTGADQINSADKQGRTPVQPVAPAAPAQAGNPAETQPQATQAPAADGAAPNADAAALQASTNLQITAVELEGDKIFVAGTAPAGRTVTGYADSSRIADATVDAKGNFVIEGQQVLSVGQHVISVDLKDASGKAVLRVSVPFNLPAGDQVAVVAPQAPPTSTPTAGATPAPAAQGAAPASGPTAAGAQIPGPNDAAAFDRQRDLLAKSFALLTNLYAAGKTPDLDALAAARSSTEIALKGLADFRPDATADAKASGFMLRMAANAATALEALKAVPASSTSAMADALPKLAALVEAALQPMAAQTPASPAASPPVTPPAPAPAPMAAVPAAPPQTASPSQPPAVPQAAAGTPPTISQAPLTEAKNTVIIRRGDTLWQISRRVYGQGVRYTTIYVANSEQIRNPNLINPGQTFTVPDQALPEKEAEDMHRRMRLENRP